MAGQTSAGVLVFRRAAERGIEFLLVHPGGPYWRGKDVAVWSIPKGLIDPGEDPCAAAVREFEEEVGQVVSGPLTALAPLKQKGGKTVLWLVEADLDLASFKSNTFELEWPPRSGRTILVPECDQAGYFGVEAARRKILPGQLGFIEQALRQL